MPIISIIINIIITIIVVVILFYLFNKYIFLRDPKRKIPEGKNIVAPADGRIIDIIDLENIEELTIPKGLIGKIKTICSDVSKKCVIISIFMSAINVHFNRAPIDGTIISTKHTNGKFLVVNTIEAGIQNEKNEILIKTSIGKIKVIQIAGLVARRISCFVQEKQKINKGQKIGLIYIGSQVSMILPKDKVEIKVKKGNKVKAGSSILAVIK